MGSMPSSADVTANPLPGTRTTCIFAPVSESTNVSPATSAWPASFPNAPPRAIQLPTAVSACSSVISAATADPATVTAATHPIHCFARFMFFRSFPSRFLPERPRERTFSHAFVLVPGSLERPCRNTGRGASCALVLHVPLKETFTNPGQTTARQKAKRTMVV